MSINRLMVNKIFIYTMEFYGAVKKSKTMKFTRKIDGTERYYKMRPLRLRKTELMYFL